MKFIKMIQNDIASNGRQSVSLTASVGMIVTMGRPLISILTLPLLLGQLGQAGLGVWMIALSLMALIGTINAGLSISLVTLIGRADTGDFEASMQSLVTAATVIAVLTAGLVLSVVVPVTLTLNWADLLNLNSEPSGEEVRRMMVTLAFLLGIGMIAAVPRQVIMGRRHGYLSHLLDFGGLVTGAVGLVISVFLNAPLWLLALSFMGPSTLFTFVGGLIYIRNAGISLFSRRHLDRKTLATLGRDSLRMAGYQIAFSISSQSDLFLIGIILGTPASAAYGVAHRVFSLPVMVASTVNYAQWPAAARADAAGDHAKVAQIFRYTLLIGSTGATSVAVVLAVTYQPLLSFWLGQGHGLETDILIVLGMVAWVAVATLVNTCDMVLRARNETKLLARAMTSMAVINVATTLILLPVIGPAGAIFGSVIGYTLALLLPYSLRLSKNVG